MVEFSDDIYTGSVGPNGFVLQSAGNPTRQYGVGPLGRIIFRDILPLTLGTANIAALQAAAANVPLVLAAGTGVTTGPAPSGSGATVFIFDVARAVSLTSTANLSGINFLITGFDEYGQMMSQLKTGPNNNTVNTLKAFKSVLSVVPSAANVGTVSVGSSDIFGLNYVVDDATDVISCKWNNTLAQDAGTLVVADLTSPATNLTGDVRGTYLPSSASSGAKHLVIGMHLDSFQAGPNSTRAAAVGVNQA